MKSQPDNRLFPFYRVPGLLAWQLRNMSLVSSLNTFNKLLKLFLSHFSYLSNEDKAFNKHILSTDYLPSTMLAAGDINLVGIGGGVECETVPRVVQAGLELMTILPAPSQVLSWCMAVLVCMCVGVKEAKVTPLRVEERQTDRERAEG